MSNKDTEIKSKLDCRVMSAFGSININDVDKLHLNIDVFQKFLKSVDNISDYFLIAHDDTNTFHIHYLIKLRRQTRLSTIINMLADGLTINTLAINIDKCRGFNQCLRYMIHIDSASKIENKKVYNVVDIVSNHNIDDITSLLQCDDENDISWESLIKGVIRFNKVSDLIKYFGLKNYHKYRFEIRDLLDEKLNSPKFMMEYSYLNDDMPF